MQYIIAIIIAISIYLLQLSYYRKHWADNLTAEISYNRDFAQIGDIVEVTEQIENRKKLPLPVLFVKFKTSRTFRYGIEENSAVSDYYYRNDVFCILGNQQVTRKLSFRTTERGYFTIDSINLVANDLFMRKTFACILDNHAFLYVYPKLFQNRTDLELINTIIGDILTKDLYEDPFSFRGIRSYTSQDSMRHINWKASAKSRQLMVNTYFDTKNTNIVLLLNLDTHTMQRMNVLKEYIISAAATLITHMISAGFSVSLAANAPDIITEKTPATESGSGDTHLHILLKQLSRLDLSKECKDICTFFNGNTTIFDNSCKHTAYLLLSNYRKKDLLVQCIAKQQQGHCIHFICPEFPSLIKGDEFYVNPSSATSQGKSDLFYTKLTNIHMWEVSSDEA